jgi:hypothetical protein
MSWLKLCVLSLYHAAHGRWHSPAHIRRAIEDQRRTAARDDRIRRLAVMRHRRLLEGQNG